MIELITIFSFLILLVIFIIVMRFVGAWMFRINDVIRELQSINYELFKLRKLVSNGEDMENEMSDSIKEESVRRTVRNVFLKD